MFFTEEEQSRIVLAIKEAEKNTSGEIKIHIASPAEQEDVVKQAASVFEKLDIKNTKQRNGVLIYIAQNQRTFAIWADKGINDVVPAGYWESTIDLMRGYMKTGEYAEGIIKGIFMIGEKLKHYFPIEKDDVNELSDDISFG